MRKLFLLLTMIVFAGSQLLWAQTKTITGTITGKDDGMPLPGVSIVVKGTTIGIVSDGSGKYSLNVPADAQKLVYSFIGMKSVEMTIANQNVINVQMISDAVDVDEVVVVGYGTQSTKRVTTSVVSVKADAIQNIPVADVSQALQGKLSGVQVAATSGRPGGAMAMSIRGRSSISASNDPLYVIDGVPISNSQDLYNTGIGQGFSPMANINPDDIASIDVLKDAAAAAIYGSRGSNGVVLITTKKGAAKDKSNIVFSSYYGIQSIIKEKKLLNASEYRQMYNEAKLSVGESAAYTSEQINNPEHDVDWLDVIQQSSPIVQNYQLSSMGGNEKTQYYLGLGYFEQEGLLHKQKFDRYSVRLNLDHKVNDFIKVGSNMSVARTERDETSYDNSIFSPWPRALIARPDQAIYNEDGSYADNAYNNPKKLFEPDMKIKISNLLTSTYGEVKIIDGLLFKSTVGVDYTVTEEDEFDPIKSYQGETVNREAQSGISRRMNYVLTQSLNYKKSFFEDRLFLDALAVYEYQDNQRDRTFTKVQGFPSDKTTTLDAGAKVLAGWTSWTGSTLESLLGRVNLAWSNKYLLGVSIRRDGSSRFPKDGRYGIFPSLSLGWNIDQEEFFKIQDVVSLLKIRGSFGETGNQSGIADFGHLKSFAAGSNYNDEAGIKLERLGNPNLKWETTRQYDLGLEIGFLNDRIILDGDFYLKKTSDLLLSKPIPATTGFSTRLENIGDMDGRGFDFTVKSVNFRGKFSWNTTLTLSTYKNEIKKLYNDQPINGSFVTRHAVGKPLGSFFLIKSLGVDPATGDMLYEDIAGNADGTPDGKITDADRQFIGNPMPKVYGGLNNDFSYKGFDLSFFFQFSYGHKLYKMYEDGTGGVASLGASAVPTNILKDVWNDRWQKAGDVASQPRVVGGTRGTYNTQRSSRYLEDASYIRLKNLTLGYTIPSRIVNKIKLESFRFYVSANNILTITDYSGFDPEISTENTVNNYGVDQGAVPQMKSIQFGFSAKF